MEVYFDGNATTFMSDETIQYMCKWMNLGNVASNHPIAIKSRAMIEDFKNRIFTDYNLRDHELFFTSGGSESNSFIVSGIVRGYYKKFKSIPHLMISSTEHKSLIMACEQYASEGFAELTYIPILMIRGRHVADMEFIKTNIKSNTCFISVMAANNETGAFYNTDDVCKISSEHNILSYIDVSDVPKESIKLYWIVNGSRVTVENISYVDTNNNTFIDIINLRSIWIYPCYF